VREAEAGGDMISYSPRTTSLSVARAQTQRDAAEERFFKALDAEVGRGLLGLSVQGFLAVVLRGVMLLAGRAGRGGKVPFYGA
jgi:hypothetical protein